MDLSFRFDLWWAGLPRSPRDEGVVRDLVVRPPNYPSGARRVLSRVELDPARGVVGDKWEHDPDRIPAAQVALVNAGLIADLAGGRSDPALAGDNLHVDLDLSESNLPPGTRLCIGEAILVVSDHPHRPCADFARRFGATAAKKVARADRRGRRGRGVLCAVEVGGVIRVGDGVLVRRTIGRVAARPSHVASGALSSP